MQKILKLLTIISICTTPFIANAVENDYKPYVGISYNYNDFNAKGFDSYNNSASIILGSTYNKYFSTEMFYQYSDEDKHGSSSGIKNSSFYGYGLDMVAYLPLGCEEKVSLLATAGMGIYTVKTEYDAMTTRDHGKGYRFGGGFSYNIDDNLSLRFITRHVELDKVKNYDHFMEYSLAVRYVFDY